MIAMKTLIRTYFFSGLMLLFSTARIQSQQPEHCPSPTNCPYGSGSGTSETELVCQTVTRLLFLLKGACLEYYGEALTITEKGNIVFELFNSPNNVCNYFSTETTVVDCLYKNGTIEPRICGALWFLANVIKPNCAEYFTISNETTTLGDLAVNFGTDPTKNCRPSTGTDSSQQYTSCSRNVCPNCVVQQCPNSTAPSICPSPQP